MAPTAAISGRIFLMIEDARSLARIRNLLGDRTPPINGGDVRHVEEAMQELQWWLDHTAACANPRKEVA